MVNWTPQQLREWHIQAMDLLVANPAISYEEMAKVLDVHPQSVRLVVTSDLFQAKLKDRREARHSQVERSVLERVERERRGKLDK
jgi:hypothetical protein